MSAEVQAPLAVCDLCLSNEIHETVNLGFLYGLSLIYPKQDIKYEQDWDNGMDKWAELPLSENENWTELSFDSLPSSKLSPAQVHKPEDGHYCLQHIRQHSLITMSEIQDLSQSSDDEEY